MLLMKTFTPGPAIFTRFLLHSHVYYIDFLAYSTRFNNLPC
jgi:hypothetical protein